MKNKIDLRYRLSEERRKSPEKQSLWNQYSVIDANRIMRMSNITQMCTDKIVSMKQNRYLLTTMICTSNPKNHKHTEHTEHTKEYSQEKSTDRCTMSMNESLGATLLRVVVHHSSHRAGPCEPWKTSRLCAGLVLSSYIVTTTSTTTSSVTSTTTSPLPPPQSVHFSSVGHAQMLALLFQSRVNGSECISTHCFQLLNERNSIGTVVCIIASSR